MRLLAAALLCVATVAHADLNVPASASVALAGGSIDLGCSDIVVAGTLSLQGGTLTNVRHLSIAAGGSIIAGSGNITLSGNWANSGSFDAGTGTVNFVDAPACAIASTISGSTTFSTLSLVSGSAKLYQFAGGSTQIITQQLTVNGTTASPIRLQSSVPGQFAFINLTGRQSMSEIAANDLFAVGTWLAPFLTNRNAAGSVVGWFGDPNAARIVPTLDQTLLFALSLLLMLLGAVFGRRNARHAKNQNV